MPYVVVPQIEPSDVADATADGQVLEDVEALIYDAANLRSEAVALPHLDVARTTDPADFAGPIVSWADQIAVTTGTSTHGDASPGTQVSPGGTDVELAPVAGARGTLRDGDVLRWHFQARVTSVTDTVPDDDLYTAYVEITGTDDNGTTVVTSISRDELGIPATYSMNPAAQPVGGDAFGSNYDIEQQQIGFSGIYIHRESDAIFSVNGGNVHIDLIRVLIFVSDATNEVVVTDATLIAMITKG